MIHILPYLEHTIRTRKSPQEIHDILQSVTSPKEEWFSSKRGKFIGEIDQYEFKIKRKIFYRNDFIPVIKGTIKQGEGAYEVALKMQPDLSTYIFLIIWYGLLGVFFLIGIFHLIISDSTDVAMVLGPIGFIAFGQILSRCGFYFPAKRAINRLEELLSAETPVVF